jgi:putative sterol carrier protein
MPMSTLPRYWTPAFVEAFVEALNTDDDFQRAASSFSDTITLRCLDTPDDEDVAAAYTFDDGQVVDVDLWIDEAPSEDLREDPFDSSEAMARATAPYSIWTKLDKGDMNVMQALSSPDYIVEGSMIRIMSNIQVFRGMNTVAAKVDKTY